MFQEVIATLNVTEEELADPDPVPPATPTQCVGNQTYDENLQGNFLQLLGQGIQISKVLIGRGSSETDYWDPSYGVQGRIIN